MERAFSFNIAGNSSFLNDSPRAGFAIDFCQHVVYILAVVFSLASLWKLRRYCWSRAKLTITAVDASIDFMAATSFKDIHSWTLAACSPETVAALNDVL